MAFLLLCLIREYYTSEVVPRQDRKIGFSPKRPRPDWVYLFQLWHQQQLPQQIACSISRVSAALDRDNFVE